MHACKAKATLCPDESLPDLQCKGTSIIKQACHAFAVQPLVLVR